MALPPVSETKPSTLVPVLSDTNLCASEPTRYSTAARPPRSTESAAAAPPTAGPPDLPPFGSHLPSLYLLLFLCTFPQSMKVLEYLLSLKGVLSTSHLLFSSSLVIFTISVSSNHDMNLPSVPNIGVKSSHCTSNDLPIKKPKACFMSSPYSSSVASEPFGSPHLPANCSHLLFLPPLLLVPSFLCWLFFPCLLLKYWGSLARWPQCDSSSSWL